MLITENKLRQIIKNSLIKKVIKENDEKTEQKNFIKNILRILNMCKGKTDDIMWTEQKIEDQKNYLIMKFDYKNDTQDNFLKNQQQAIKNIDKKYYNSPLEILFTNLFRNYKFIEDSGKISKINQKKDKRPILISLINDESKHKEIVNRLIKTVAYRQRTNPAGRYREEDYTSPEAKNNMDKAWTSPETEREYHADGQ